MASIYKRGKTWWIHYVVGGKSVSKSLKTGDERAAIAKKRQFDALDELQQLPQPSNTPIELVLQSFCEFLMATGTRKSAKNDMSRLRGFFGPRCKALKLGSHVPRKFRQPDRKLPLIPDKLRSCHVPAHRLEDISAELISNHILERRAKDHIGPKTANHIREVLHRLFRYAAERHGYVCPDRRFRNPVDGVDRATESAPVITWLDDEQIEAQLKTLEDEPELRTLVAVYIYAGLRREEALWLTPSDVDLSRKMIHVRAKTVGGEFWQPKTKRNRSVPISKTLHIFLSKHRPPSGSLWYFLNPQGRRWDPDDLSARLREINKAAGLPWSCLDFRHTFGSHLAQKGESLYKIAELMGNSPEICRRHYAALVPEKMHDTVEFNPTAKGSETEELLKKLLAKLEQVGVKTDDIIPSTTTTM